MTRFLVTDDFSAFFHQNAETVNNRKACWVLEKTIPGNITDLGYFLSIADAFIKDFAFFEIEGAFVPYYQELFGKDMSMHRYVNDNTMNYGIWKASILQFENKPFPQELLIELGENFELTVNYKLRTESKLVSLYKGPGYGETIVFSFEYAAKLNTTRVSISVFLRSELFYEFPWKNENVHFFNLKENVRFNRELFEESMKRFMQNNDFILSHKYAEMKLPDNCVGDYGFSDSPN